VPFYYHLRIIITNVTIATSRTPIIVIKNTLVAAQYDTHHKTQVKDRIASIMHKVNTIIADHAVTW
jgi:hypothetical protein